MKKVTRNIIKVIGVMFIIAAVICAIKGHNDGVFNGLDFAVAFFGIVGAYLTFGSEASLVSWSFNFNNKSEEEDEDEDENYEYDEYPDNTICYPFPSDEKSSRKNPEEDEDIFDDPEED